MSVIFTGAKAVVKLDNNPIAFASSINISHENKLEEIPQLDDMLVAEYAENGHRCSFSVNIFKVAGQTAADLGLDPVDLKTILTLPELVVEVYDSTTNLPVYTMEGVKFKGGSGAVDSRGVWVGTWNFVCRRGRGI